MNLQGWVGTLLLTLQFGFQPFVTSAFLPRDAVKSVLVIIQEIFKIIICVVILLSTGRLKSSFKDWSISESLQLAFWPSFLYSFQNVLAFYAFLNLDPLTFNLINQCKIIFAALFIAILLQKYQSNRQKLALSLLFIVALLLSYDAEQSKPTELSANSNDDKSNKNIESGLIAVVFASMLSGLAGTLVQKALQTGVVTPRHTLVFSIELGVISVVCLVVRLIVEYALGVLDGDLIYKFGPFQRLDGNALIPIALNAVGGIIVGFVTKYAGVIAKSYGLIGGILLAGLLRSFWFAADKMTPIMIIAVPLVMLSLYLNADTKEKKDKKKTQ